MNILYCGDSNISDGVIISVISLLRNVNEPINIYLLTAGLSVGNKEYSPLTEEFALKLDRYVKAVSDGSSVRLFDITERFLNELPTANIGTRFTPFCMLRLFADSVPELPDRLLYLDNDVICRKDCTPFYNQDISGCEVSGVPDFYGRFFYGKSIFGLDYLNSGVLLLNLELIRKNGLFKKCRKLCAEKQMLLPDQAAINRLTLSKKKCERKYNEQHRLKNDTVFRHFTTNFRFFPKFRTVTVKPWDIDRMHSVLGTYEFDGLYREYELFKTREDI